MTNTIVVPTQLAQLQSLQTYFQHLRPLNRCDADDGRIVGRLLMELVDSNPKDLAQAIRTFAHRTTMLRECGFRRIAAMLERLLCTDTEHAPDSDAAIAALSPSSATEKQASAIGRVIVSSIRRSHEPATALREVLNSHAVLRAMESGFAWFVPMVEVLVAQKVAKSRRSTVMRRLSSLVTRPSVAPIGGQSDGGEDDASGFSSVVRCP